MIYLRQSTASQKVPLGHFVDDADGKTAETGLTIANTDIKVWKAGATTLASKNSGGATHISGGVYYAALDATDTDTVGPLVLFVAVSGALAVRLECVVLEEAMYDWQFGTKVPLAPATAGRDLVVDAAGLADANVVKLGPSGSGTAQTARDIGASVLLSSGTGTGQLKLASGYVAMTWADIAAPTTTVNLSGTIIGTATSVSGLANNVITAASIATGAITNAKFASGAIDAAAIAADAIGASELAADAVTEIQSGLSTLTQANIRTAVGLASANLDTQLATLPTAVEVAQIVYPAHGSVIFVRPSAADDSGAGTRPTAAKQTLAGAVAAATAGDRIVLSAGVHAVTSEVAIPASVPVQGQEDGRTVIDISTFSNPTTTACLLLQGARQSVTGLHFDDGGTTEYRLVIGNLSGDTAYTDAFLCRNTSRTDTDWLMGGVSGDSAFLIDNHIRSKYDTVRLTGGNGTFDIIGGSYVAIGPSGQDSGVRTRNISNAGGGNVVRLFNVGAVAGGASGTNAAVDVSGGTTYVFGGTLFARDTGATAISQSVVGAVTEVGAAYDPTSKTGTVTQTPRPADVTKTSVALTESYPTDGSAMTLGQGIYLTIAHLGEMSISGTTKTLKKLDGSTTAATFTLDSATDPTSITRAT